MQPTSAKSTDLFAELLELLKRFLLQTLLLIVMLIVMHLHATVIVPLHLKGPDCSRRKVCVVVLRKVLGHCAAREQD